ncbi:hypothetical protein MMC18_007560 [Xylographa bjoerkii]|nr:hypothetical protein [Xylographa bjoerkii]
MTSHPDFGRTTTSTEVARVFSKQIRGKNVVITGVSPKSLGEAMALSVASQNPAHLILASRTEKNLNDVVSRIRELFPLVSLEAILVDLSAQESVRQAAVQISSLVKQIDVLINNAGLMVPKRQVTKDGIELQLATNHVGPFLLTNLLMPMLVTAATSSPSGSTRVINVTSSLHSISPFRLHDPNFEGKDLPSAERPPPGLPPSLYNEGDAYPGFVAYAQCKTANVLTAVYLTKQLSRLGIVSYSVDPGFIWTGLSRNVDAASLDMLEKSSDFWKTQDQGAATMLVAAFDPKLDASSGCYLRDCQPAEATAHALSYSTAQQLWALSEVFVGQKFDLEQYN